MVVKSGSFQVIKKCEGGYKAIVIDEIRTALSWMPYFEVNGILCICNVKDSLLLRKGKVRFFKIIYKDKETGKRPSGSAIKVLTNVELEIGSVIQMYEDLDRRDEFHQYISETTELIV